MEYEFWNETIPSSHERGHSFIDSIASTYDLSWVEATCRDWSDS